MAIFTQQQISDIAAIGPLESSAAQEMVPGVMADLMNAANNASADIVLSSGTCAIEGVTNPSGGVIAWAVPIGRVTADSTLKSCILFGVVDSSTHLATYNGSTYTFAFHGDDNSDVVLATVSPASAELVTETVLSPVVVPAVDGTLYLAIAGVPNGTFDRVKGDVVARLA